MYITQVFFPLTLQSLCHVQFKSSLSSLLFKYHSKSFNQFPHQLNFTFQSPILAIIIVNLIRASSNPTSRLTSMYNPGALLMPSRRHYTRALYIIIKNHPYFSLTKHALPPSLSIKIDSLLLLTRKTLPPPSAFFFVLSL